MLKSFSPKYLKNSQSHSHMNSQRKEPSFRKHPSQQTSLLSKKLSGEGHINPTKIYAINHKPKPSMKLSHKYDPNKKYLFNSTTSITPYNKYVIPSNASTPLEKSLNIKMGGNSVNLFQQDNSIASKGVYHCRKQLEPLFFTDKEKEGKNAVKVTFLISTGHGKKSVGKKKQKENSPKNSHILSRTVSMAFSNIAAFSSIKTAFLKSNKCLNEEIQKNYYGLRGFETVPFNYQLTNLINNCPTRLFQTLLSKNIREITLAPILIKNKLNYDCLEFKDFEMIKHLGSGGFSTVFLGKCLLDGQLCALKFILKNSLNSVKKIRMLDNQRHILFRIRHPNLVQMYYAFETENYIIFGLEYCPNGNLYSFLQKRKSFTEIQIKFILRQLLDGLEYLHQNNILFRDIKLENILLDGDGNIKITDFGLSKPDIGDEEITYSYCGSPEYMAPEMLSKNGHSFEVDYYALGILLYELFYGHSPFYAPKKQDIFNGIMNNEVPFPKHPTISKEAKALVRGLLTKNPKHRIGSLNGIKEIGSHPWMRNYNLESSREVVFPFNKAYDPQASADKKINNPIFDKQKQQSSSQKTFFQNSFVNNDLKKRVLKEIVPLKSLNQQYEILKQILKGKDDIDRILRHKISISNQFQRKQRQSYPAESKHKKAKKYI